MYCSGRNLQNYLSEKYQGKEEYKIPVGKKAEYHFMIHKDLSYIQNIYLYVHEIFLRDVDLLPIGYSFLMLSIVYGSDGKDSAYNAGDLGSIPGSGRSLREGNGNPLPYSCLENSMDRGAWQDIAHGVAKSWTWLSDFHFKVYLLFFIKI